MLKLYQQFKPQNPSIKAPLHALACPKFKGSQTVDWTSSMVQTIKDCKASLSRAKLLANPDPTAKLVLLTDPSDIAIGAALQRRVCDDGNPCLPTPISSVPLNKSTPRTTSSSWQCMRPSNTSDIWSKAAPFSSLRVTSLSLKLSSKAEITAHDDSSVTWNLLENMLLATDMSQGKTTL